MNGQVPEVNKNGSDSGESDVPPPRKVIKKANGKRKVIKAEPSPDIESDISGKDKGLPSFMSSKWRSVFLPTLRWHMFCSKRPFSDYVKSDIFVAEVQKIVTLVWPETKYIVTRKSSVFLTASTMFTPR